ncbi:MAG: biotin--[acetyl-CoA-carboxylase] ligase [Pseudanabaenaceae cyanobacterium]
MSLQYFWLKFVETCPSTNAWANDHCSELIHGDVVFTRRQTAGRGQGGRVWLSPAGVLTASFVLDDMAIPHITGLSLVTGLAVISAVETLVPQLQNKLQLKWVNDIWLDCRKVGGILCEVSGERAIVGVGFNLCARFENPEAIGNPISLHELVADVPEDVSLLAEMRSELLWKSDNFRRNGLTDFVAEWNDRDALRGKKIKVQLEDQILSGIDMGIDPQGRLQLQTAKEEIHSLITLINGRIIHWES